MARLWVVALVLLSAFSAGCRRDPARVTARRMDHLLVLASRDLSCPTVGLEAAPLEEHLYRVTGCNQWADYWIRGTGRGRYRGARWVPVVSVAERAETDLGCPAAMISFEPVSPRDYRVAGCGRAASMSLVCGELDCGWLSSGVAGAPVAGTGASGSTVSGSAVIVVTPAP